GHVGVDECRRDQGADEFDGAIRGAGRISADPCDSATISHQRGRPTRMDLSVPVEGAHASKHAVRFAAARQWVTVRDIRIRWTDQGAMAASIEDVAKLAGVSIATVSRSLRGLPDVATTTRDRVFAAAR